MAQIPVVSNAAAAARYAWRGGRLLTGFVRERPIHCIVQVSNRCNLTCGFCSFWERPAHPRDEMTVEDFEIISAKLAEGGAMVVSIEGRSPSGLSSATTKSTEVSAAGSSRSTASRSAARRTQPSNLPSRARRYTSGVPKCSGR